MPETKRPLKVFLCHAHSDVAAVRALYTRLKREGVDVWLDKEKLLPGQDWELEIRKAVRKADVVIVCLSKQFNQAGFRQKEVRIALETAMGQPEGEIFIIPLRLEECENLESLSKWHWVDLFEVDGYHKLIWALRARAEKVGATLRIRRRAKSVTTELESNDTEKIIQSPIDSVSIGDLTFDNIVVAKVQEAVGEVPEEKQFEVPPSKPKEQRVKTQRKPNIAIIVALIAFAGTVITALLGSPLLERRFSALPAPTQSAMATVTLTSQPISASQTTEPGQTATGVPSQTQTTVPPITTLVIGTTIISDKDGMTLVYVPAGEFAMGSNNMTAEEKPEHTVYLDAFWIDQTEITVKMYSLCVSAGICKDRSLYIQTDYLSNHKFDNYPMIDVSWEDAITYCEWVERRLPTEAEWEKAARGEDGFIYPWGNDFDGARVNFCDSNCSIGTPNASFDDGFAETAPVGNYSNGASPYGALDMAGNVSEWVADWYSETYYANSPPANPLGPDSGRYRVTRGGSWASIDFAIRSSYRGWDTPNRVNLNLGFRCAKDANP